MATMQGLTDEFQALQKGAGPTAVSADRRGNADGMWSGADLSAVVEARQRLDSQLQENKSVQKVRLSLFV